MFYPFQNLNALKGSNSYCQKLNEVGVLDIINENKRLFDPNWEAINNAFVRLSHIQNKVSDADFSIDYDDDMTENSDDSPLSEGLRILGCVNMSNKMISNDSVRKMIQSLNFQ